MPLTDPARGVLSEWFDLFDANLTFPAYRWDNPVPDTAEYILLRVETDTLNPNNNRLFSTLTVVTEIVKKVGLSDALTEEALTTQEDMLTLVYPAPGQNALGSANLTGFRIVNVQKEQTVYLTEADQTFKYMRVITRHLHKIEYT
jgi:hypothetical protein